jgi:hypothetical protein
LPVFPKEAKGQGSRGAEELVPEPVRV